MWWWRSWVVGRGVRRTRDEAGERGGVQTIEGSVVCAKCIGILL